MVDCVNGRRFWSKRCEGGYPPEVFEFAKGSFIAKRDMYSYNGRGNQDCKQTGDELYPHDAFDRNIL